MECRRDGSATLRGLAPSGALLLCGMLLATPARAPAQGTATVQGRVTTDDGRPVQGADVRVGDEARTLTDGNGAFRLSGLSSGRHTVTVSYLGFQTARKRLKLEAGESRRLSIGLSREAIEVAEIVVQVPSRRRVWARRMFSDLIRQHGHLLSRRQIEERDPNRTSDLLLRIPGISVLGTREDGIGRRVVVRCGGRPREPSLYLDGGLMPDLDIDAIPPDQIAALGVVRGPSVSTLTPGCGAVVIVTRAMLASGDPAR